MARQETNILERLQRRSPQEREQYAALTKLAARDALNRRFERVSKGPQTSKLYAESSEYNIGRLERLWRESVFPYSRLIAY